MPESTHLVLFEHDRLTIGHRYACAGGGSFLFDARHFDALSRFGARATWKPFTLGHGNVPGAVEILGGGLIAPEVILGAVKDKSRHEEDCHKSHQKNQ